MSEVQTLARGLRILELLADTEDGLSSTELTGLLSIDKSSISRLMKTLVKYRFADRDSQTRRYFLGTHIQDLGQRAGQHAELRELATPHLKRLGVMTSENAHIAVYASPHALTIADVPSTAPLRVVSEVGRRMPLHCSAVGKCLLAFSSIPLPTSQPSFTKKTIEDTRKLSVQLNQIRRQKFALDDEELSLGVRGLAVPIRNREGRTIATMGLSGPTVRLTNEAIPSLVELLKKTAGQVSAELGYIPR